MLDKLVEAVSWITGQARETLRDTKELARWVWEVLQGDFNEDQDVSHVVANASVSIGVTVTGIGVVVAWLMDLRDLIANATHIYQAAKGESAPEAGAAAAQAGAPAEPETGLDFGRVPMTLWIALIATLIGVIPAVGDLAKGVFRIILIFFKRVARAMPELPVVKQVGKATDDAMPAIRELLERPLVRKFMAGLGWHRPFMELAKEFKKMKGLATYGNIMQQFDELVDLLKNVIGSVHRWLPGEAKAKIEALYKTLDEVRAALDAQVARLIHPFRECLDEIIIRLEKEDLASYGTRTGRLGSHYFGRIKEGDRAWREVRNEPYLVRKAEVLEPAKYEDIQALIDPRLKEGWPDIPEGSYATFHTIRADILKNEPGKPPVRLYRVVDPEASAGGLFWMSEEDFRKLASRAEWRDRYAVKHDWNANGQFVVYELKAGEELKVWRGPAASQKYDTNLWYRGGGEQIVFMPDRGQVFTRSRTGWGYLDHDLQLLNERVMIDLQTGTKID